MANFSVLICVLRPTLMFNSASQSSSSSGGLFCHGLETERDYRQLSNRHHHSMGGACKCVMLHLHPRWQHPEGLRAFALGLFVQATDCARAFVNEISTLECWKRTIGSGEITAYGGGRRPPRHLTQRCGWFTNNMY